MLKFFIILILFLFNSCRSKTFDHYDLSTHRNINLSIKDKAIIGNKIWNNECNGTVEGLVHWNYGEGFPSLGIGHFIWYVKNNEKNFEESFPKLINYMKTNNVFIPTWINLSEGSPWKTRNEFLDKKNSYFTNKFRIFLKDNINIQVEFIIFRLRNSLSKMLSVTYLKEDKEKLLKNFNMLLAHRSGLYCLIDYVNFKGEGIKSEEKYLGQGWGLRDVLLEMNASDNVSSQLFEFSEASKRVLLNRIKNSPKTRNEHRWKKGWISRCNTYKNKI